MNDREASLIDVYKHVIEKYPPVQDELLRDLKKRVLQDVINTLSWNEEAKCDIASQITCDYDVLLKAVRLTHNVHGCRCQIGIMRIGAKKEAC